MRDEILELLKSKDLKNTPVRQAVLNALIKSPFALSQNEIEVEFGNQFDRITLYRTLKSFEEKGLIHRIYNSFGEAKYAICAGTCKEHSHADYHLHFNCLKCKHTFCIKEVHIPSFVLPEGMRAFQYNFSVEGFCASCS